MVVRLYERAMNGGEALWMMVKLSEQLRSSRNIKCWKREQSRCGSTMISRKKFAKKIHCRFARMVNADGKRPWRYSWWQQCTAPRHDECASAVEGTLEYPRELFWDEHRNQSEILATVLRYRVQMVTVLTHFAAKRTSKGTPIEENFNQVRILNSRFWSKLADCRTNSATDEAAKRISTRLLRAAELRAPKERQLKLKSFLRS